MLTAYDVITELSSLLPELREEDILTKPVEREYFCGKVEEILNDDRVDGQTNVKIFRLINRILPYRSLSVLLKI